MPANTDYSSFSSFEGASIAASSSGMNQQSARLPPQPVGIATQGSPWDVQIEKGGSHRLSISAKVPPAYDPGRAYRHGDTVAINDRMYTLVTSGSGSVKGVPPEGAGAPWCDNPWWFSGLVPGYQVSSHQPGVALPGQQTPSRPPAPAPTPTLPGVDSSQSHILSQDTWWTYPSESPSSTSMQHSHPQMYARSQAVFKVKGRGEVGTAFRLGPNNVFMTNAHVIRHDPHKTTYELVAGYEDAPSHRGAKKPIIVRIDKVLFRSNRDDHGIGGGMDVVVFSIDPRDYQSGVLNRFGYLGIDPLPPRIGEEIYMPNHAYGGPRRIAYRDSNGASSKISWPGSSPGGKLQYITYNVLQAGGASGSPVIDAKTHQVVGINHSGMNGDTPGGSGTSMHVLFPYIANLFPGGKSPQGSPLPV